MVESILHSMVVHVLIECSIVGWPCNTGDEDELLLANDHVSNQNQVESFDSVKREKGWLALRWSASLFR